MRRGFAVLLGAVLLATTGCTLIDRAGAAVVVDGNRYTTEQLAADFRSLDKALGSADKPGTMDEVNRSIIGIVIVGQLMDKAIAAENLTIDKAAVAQLRRDLERQLGGKEKLLEFAATRGVPPNFIWSVLRQSIFSAELGAKLIGGTDTDAQAAASNAYLQELSKQTEIEVAPRYGRWDAEKFVTAAPLDDLSIPTA